MTKIDIYSGFLGAGKTTLIKKMIKEAYHGQKLVLIENEFGEIGIDGGFLQEAGIQITEMNSGCICCSLVGDFGRALKKVIAEYAPDRILIEPSGVGKLSDVIGAVRKVTSDDVQLGNFVTVADATKCKMYMKNFGEFYNNQIESAGTIILSRTQMTSQEKLDKALELLKRGHRLVADDVVEIKKVSDATLVGRAPDITRHFIELRGIGIIDVKSLFGVECVKIDQNIDLVINLEEWSKDTEYDRLGLEDNYMEFLGNKVVSHNIPIRPGRNIAIIVESAAVNHRQKKMGYNAAEELYKRVQANLAKKREEK